MIKSKALKISVCLFICLIFISNYTFSQSNRSLQKKLNKNAIYGEVGYGNFYSIDEFYYYTTLYYERILKQNFLNEKISSFLRFGLGQIYTNTKTYSFTKAQCELLVGGRAHHLELIAGLTYYFNLNRDRQKPLLLSPSIGYRYQKPGRKFLFRIGMGSPDIFYLGIGWSF